MGERLNIEIIKNGKTLANAYYHWSGYSNSAVELASTIIKNIEKINSNDSDIFFAIRLLELTGAGLTDKEIEFAKTINELKEIKFKECKGRNEGLIGISQDGINETRRWQEHALYIYLDEKRMSFQVFWKNRFNDYEVENKDEDNYIEFDELEKVDINFDDIKFSEIDNFVEFINNHLENLFVTYIDCWNVINMIY